MSDRILVCDPDPRMQRALAVILREAGYRAITTRTGEEALRRVADDRPQAVILELALPDIDGLELCSQLRERCQNPIVVVSAIDEETAKVEALMRGADDYLTKPFSPGELVARLAARLRATSSELRFESDGLVIDLVSHVVTLDGEEIHLTATEFALLRVLATSGGPVTHQSLARKVWGPLRNDAKPRVRTHIGRLRAKLDGPHRDLIRTEVGLGYRLAGV